MFLLSNFLNLYLLYQFLHLQIYYLIFFQNKDLLYMSFYLFLNLQMFLLNFVNFGIDFQQLFDLYYFLILMLNAL